MGKYTWQNTCTCPFDVYLWGEGLADPVTYDPLVRAHRRRSANRQVPMYPPPNRSNWP